jgi:leucyl/phenylalanyl-tRNA---protein transferase
MTTVRSAITPSQVLTAYRHGLFPMARGRFGSIEWFLAEPRTVIPLDDRFRIPRTIKRLVRRGGYTIRIDCRFEEVLRACARHSHVGTEEIWLSEEMIQLYMKLHELGHAHSVEVWSSEDLVGGLYGVALKAAFFGESMFSRVPSASQLALVGLVERLKERSFKLLDTQMRTPHIARFGAIDLTHDEYLANLALAMTEDREFV